MDGEPRRGARARRPAPPARPTRPRTSRLAAGGCPAPARAMPATWREPEPQRALGDRRVRDARRRSASASGPSGQATRQRPLEPRHAVEQHPLGAAEHAGIGRRRAIAPAGHATVARHGDRRRRAPTSIAAVMAPRRVPGTPGLRARTARGGAVNAAFLSGAELLVLVQGLLATALLGPELIGLYGIVTTTAMTIVALRRVGIDEAFVQTAADDEEAEFQRALTVELALGRAGRARGRGARAGARRRLRRRPAARAHAGGDVSAGGVRAAGAAVGVLQAHGVRAAADAAGDRAARDGRGRGAAAARGRRASGRS